ncbi:MAG: extracellular solute-binding protein [Clostridiales bacterium]|nr:extracellular solute-binding protein [Clostridiales bacterium]
MKKLLSCVLVLTMVLGLGAMSVAAAEEKTVYPAGTVTIYATGQPQFQQMYFDNWLERNRDIAPEVTIEFVQVETQAAGRQKIAMDHLAGAYDDMPDATYVDSVSVVDLSSAGLLLDMTDFYAENEALFVEGAANDATIQGKVWGVPENIRPQVLFYNNDLFEKYDVDPAMMATMEGYLEAGRLLKEKSDGEVFLSYIDPTTYTWRYWGRRGLMPQANARIWDDAGNVIVGEDEGTKLALGFLAQLHDEELLYKTTMMSPPLYEATDEGKIATFYIGAFWDEFLRSNLSATAGQWRVMNAPVFEEVGTAGAPVSSFMCLVDNGTNEYAGLVQKMWLDFHTDNEARKTWVNEMVEIGGAYSNPITLEMLADPFWQETAEFYGDTSFRKAEGEGLNNPSKNMVVTIKDAEADTIISNEIEKYVAGEQTMEEAIANMDRELNAQIGTTEIP